VFSTGLRRAGFANVKSGHEYQRQAPARWSATLQPRWGAPGDDPAVRQLACGKRGSGLSFGPFRWEISVTSTDATTSNDVASPPAATEWAFETRQIHAGQVPDPTTGARALPIYQTTSYAFRDSDHAAKLFGLQEFGNIYTRLMNPTTDAVEQRISNLEGGVGALLVASGQSAQTLALLNLAETGDHIVSSPSLYGGSYNLLRYTLPKLGITTTFVDDPGDPQAWRAAVRPNTKAFFGETIANPKQDILDIAAIAAVAHEVGVPLVVDNTVATPYLIRPLEWGADIVIHSATKYLGGHGTAIAGAIVDGGRFDFAAAPARFPNYNEPDPSYHGLVYARDLGVNSPLGANLAYILKARVQLLRDLGPAVSPFNAFLIAQGLETLSLRMERHCSNALAVASWLQERPEVTSVAYAGLPSSPWFESGQKYAPRGTGGVLAFELAAGVDAGRKFVDSLTLHSHVANIGDVRSLVIHPSSTTHSQLNEQDQLAAGVTPGLVRLAVGLEHVNDLVADLEVGLAASSA
jgi:O-acetylhomoserine (thiol)-lyase